MKKLTSILLLLLFVWTVQAQTARAEDVYRENQQGQTSWQKRDKN